jgi:hypothetical protein
MQPAAIRLQALCRLAVFALRASSANGGFRERDGNLSGMVDAKGRAGGGRKALLSGRGGEQCSDVTHHSGSFFTSHLIASPPQKHLRIAGKVNSVPTTNLNVNLSL